jgi:hypothetical protein
MAHYAFLNKENVVTEVIVGVDESQLIEGKTPEEFYSTLRNQPCVRTSFNSTIRFNFAGIGYTYDSIDDAFIAPMPNCGHQELLLNEIKQWECANEEHDVIS